MAKLASGSCETITLLITYEMHKSLPIAQRGLKLRKCAKSIYHRTKNKTIKDAMRNIRGCKDDAVLVRQIGLVSRNWGEL